jgi:hypothetical protein
MTRRGSGARGRAMALCFTSLLVAVTSGCEEENCTAVGGFSALFFKPPLGVASRRVLYLRRVRRINQEHGRHRQAAGVSVSIGPDRPDWRGGNHRRKRCHEGRLSKRTELPSPGCASHHRCRRGRELHRRRVATELPIGVRRCGLVGPSLRERPLTWAQRWIECGHSGIVHFRRFPAELRRR